MPYAALEGPLFHGGARILNVSATLLKPCSSQAPSRKTSVILHVFQLRYGALVDDVAGVQGRGGFEQQEPAFFVGYGLVFHSARDDDELAFFDQFVMLAKVFIPEMHAEAAFDNQKHFVFMLVVMEDEFAFELIELDRLPVQLGSDVGLPVFGDPGEFFGDIDFTQWILPTGAAQGYLD